MFLIASGSLQSLQELCGWEHATLLLLYPLKTLALDAVGLSRLFQVYPLLPPARSFPFLNSNLALKCFLFSGASLVSHGHLVLAHLLSAACPALPLQRSGCSPGLSVPWILLIFLSADFSVPARCAHVFFNHLTIPKCPEVLRSLMGNQNSWVPFTLPPAELLGSLGHAIALLGAVTCLLFAS